MSTDTAILLLLADLQAQVVALKAEVAALKAGDVPQERS